jgi:multiple antibiotic resistance protein
METTSSYSLFSTALTFFLVTNPIGNSPAIVALIKDYDLARQKKIMLREALISLALALFFQYFGEFFLSKLHIQDYAVTLCGGILLFMVALNMIFSLSQPAEVTSMKQEPFIVPIATPLLSGPGLLTIIMLYSREVGNNLMISSAILIAWIGVTLVLITAPYLQKILGKRGLIALEQLMGMILAMIAMEMIVKGFTLFFKALNA